MAEQALSERSIFEAAIEKGSSEERAAYLYQACSGNEILRKEVEALLAAHDRLGGGHGTLDESSLTEHPGTAIGPYKLLEQIGEGGFGVVFMAEQTQPVRRKVALKILKPGMDTRQVVARFEAERQALALMDHPNIARVLDGGQTASGRPYFVMDLVKGLPITDYCDQAQLTTRERLTLFVDLCRAVQHAHQKGVIHRDLKPSNVLVTVHDTTPVVKVIDFGVAKALGQELTDKTLFTGFAQMLGTPLYMSPEQAGQSGLDVDTRSDIYSLGVLLYELLTGTTPFDKNRLKEVGYEELRRIIHEEEPPRPSTRISTLAQAATTVATQRKSDPRRLSQLFRGELDWIVMKALEKDRNHRYETVSTFAADVERYLADEPVVACPPSVSYRMRKFMRRNKRALASAAVVGVAVLLVVGVVAASLGWMARDRSVRRAKLNLDIEHALDEADRAREHALKLTDNPHRWEAALAEAAADLKRAQGLAAQDETALEPATQQRLEHVQTLLNADESDRRFAARFEEILFEQYEAHMASESKMEIAFAAQREAFQHHYAIAFGTTPVERAAAIIKQRSTPIQDVLLGALEICLEHVPGEDGARPWLVAVLGAADTGPWRKRAQQAVQAGDWKAFEQIFEEAVKSRQTPSLLDRLVARTPWGSPVHLKLLRRFQEAYPGDFWANHSLAGYLHYTLSHHEEAIRYYIAALALRPHNPVACVNLGHAFQALGDVDAAIHFYREALDGHPDYAGARESLGIALERKGDLDGGIAQLRKATQFRHNAWDHHVILGGMLLRKGLLKEAIDSYGKAIELNPKYAAAWNCRGAAYCDRLDQPAKAVADFSKAIELDPKDMYPWRNRGVAHSKLHQYDQAAADFSRAIELSPKDASAWSYRGVAYAALGQWERAIRDLSKALQLKAADADAHNGLAWVLATCPESRFRNPGRAVELAEKAVKLSPKKGPFWNTLGVAQYRVGDWQAAVKALDKSLQLQGDNGWDFFFLSMAHWRLAHQQEARKWYDQAVAWMATNQSTNEELRRFRAEAEELMKTGQRKD